jgi:hypothetical protein
MKSVAGIPVREVERVRDVDEDLAAEVLRSGRFESVE